MQISHAKLAIIKSESNLIMRKSNRTHEGKTKSKERSKSQISESTSNHAEEQSRPTRGRRGSKTHRKGLSYNIKS
ncbi:hypothetical protein Dimus_039714 [Dionaea muscipula]